MLMATLGSNLWSTRSLAVSRFIPEGEYLGIGSLSAFFAPNPRTDERMTSSKAPPGASLLAPENVAAPHPCTLVVGLGASAGGLEPLERFVAHVALDMGISYVVIQHLSPDHPSMLARILAQHTQLPVIELVDGLTLAPNHIYVLMAGTVATISAGKFNVRPLGDEHRGRVDVFFQSLAEDQGERAVGILLSGAGSDGTEGLRAIKAHGGRTIVQEPETASYAAMPQSALDANLVDISLPVETMPSYLVDRAHDVPGILPDIDSGSTLEEVPDEQILGSLDHICDVLRSATGRDFSQYKRGTLIRRLRHRIQMRRLSSIDEYTYLLDHDPQEPQLLSKELLVGVTRFFRDSEVFEYLQSFILPQIFASVPAKAGIRIWVPGCASGEEAYSIAILLREQCATMRSPPSVQIFATDIDPDAIAEARAGRYSLAIADQMSPERLSRYFTRNDSGYQIGKEVRELCLFSEHSLIRDPPFLGLDLISCRNVLIYLQASLQRKLVPIFHYALRRGGYLLLGPSEGLAGQTQLFHTMDKRFRIFQRVEAVSRPFIEWPVMPPAAPRMSKLAPREALISPPQEQNINATFERLLLQEYVPPSAVVNEHGNVVCVAGLTGPYFQPPAGLLTTNILEIAHTSLRVELRTALHSAARSGINVVRDNVFVEIDGSIRRLRLTVRPVPRFEQDGFFVIILQEQRSSMDMGEPIGIKLTPESPVEQLESELRLTRASLRSSIEELESANEELKSSNEELLSTNEEMQSSNEELQSSQEELKSVNEELATVNAELGRRIDELGRANTDLQTLFSSTDVATLFLDREQRLTKFTPAARSLFRLIDADAHRPLSDLAPRFHQCNLAEDVANVLETLQPFERQVETFDRQAWYLLRILPYRTNDEQVVGTVVTLIDITQSKHLDAERERLVSQLRDAQGQLQADLDATTRLLKIGSLFLRGGNMSLVLDDILDAAIAISGADFGVVQLLDRTTRDLKIMAYRGLPRTWLDHWNQAAVGQGIRETALDGGFQILVEDLETHPRFIGTKALDIHLEAGVRALQSTPISGRSGAPIGLITTYYKARRKPDERILRLLDLVARQAADILERAYAEDVIRDSERRFRVLIEATTDVPYRMSPDWAEMRQLSGRGFVADTVTPTRNWLEQYIHPDDRGRMLEVIQEAVRSKSIFQFEHRMLKPDGSYAWASSRAAPLVDDRGEIIEWFGIARDTTERKRAELELEQANQLLRDADQRKNEFLAMLSHELRNPMAAIATSLYLIEHATAASDTFNRAKTIIRRQMYYLTRLVDDLLDTTRLTRGKIHLQKERFDLNELVSQTAEDHRSSFEQRGISLDVSRSPNSVWVNGDRTRLSQVLGNLLQNAVKFTLSGGKTHVQVRTADGQALVHVKDTGNGLSADALPQIFEPFTQVDADLERSRGGLGLGLAIARGLVELHGGTVSAASDGLGKGTTVTITLPIESSGQELPAVPAKTEGPRQHRVTLIEDNHDAAATLQDVLTLRGHEVAIAHDGLEGIDLVKHFRPTVVICDIGLPGMNGYEVARKLRSDESFRGVLLVALSGYGGPEDVLKAKEAGFDVHLVKPPNLDALDRVLMAPPRVS